MEDIGKRIAALSPAKRALLQQKLLEKRSGTERATLAKKDSRGPTPLQERPERLPLSYAQQRLWFLDKLEGSSAEYNIREALRLKGRLDCRALEQAVDALIERHETLRTHFIEQDGEPLQVVQPAAHVSIVSKNLSELDPAERERAVDAALRSEAAEPFDLSRGPLLRMRLLKLDEHEHVLLSTFHHIIFDGWSIAIFNRDLSALYEAFRRGDDNPLKPLSVQYPDYAIWQRDRLQGEELQRQLTFWKSQLAGAPTLALLTDLARPMHPTFVGARQHLIVPLETSLKLKQISRQANATLFMTLLAAFQVLLSRYSAQEDISVGIPAANRNHLELEDLIGFFLDTLVLRTDLSGNPSFRELLRRVQKVTLDAYAHADVPFERLVQELQPERSLNQTPLFQAFLNFLSFESDIVKLSGLEAERCLKESVKSKFDLTLYVREADNGLYLGLAYSTELFLPATIERMMRHFQILLDAIVANPEVRIGALPMLTPEERVSRKVSDQRIRPTNPYVHFGRDEIEQSIPARFAKQVQRAPHRLAVQTLAFRWTYKDLDQSSNNIAHEILRRCGKAEQQVALLLEHDAPMIAATLGVLKSGKAYVPLDPAYPVARLAGMIEDSQTSAIITDEANKSLAEELALEGIAVLHFADLEDRHAGEEVSLASPDAMAYLLYTSGSTGEPKAITQSHRNVLHHIASYTNSLHICAEDRVLLVATLGVDAAVQGIFGALLNGATLCAYDIRNNELSALAEWMANEKISIFHSTPSLYRYFVAALSERRWTFAKLRLVVLGGEKVLPSDIELYKEHFEPGCILVNGFGLSESTVTLQCLFDAHYEDAGSSIPIGNPVEDTEVLLLNARGDAGQVCGEIAIRSAYLAQGYWRRPELTAAAFLPDPEKAGRRIYRTGDMGRLLPNGMIEFLGRRDFQVKIRGYRVECAEIELALSKHPEVTSAAVVARQNTRGEQDLIAYVVPRQDSSISSRQLRDFATTILPSYMVPQAILPLEKMPLTATGKINRKALPVPEDVLSHGAQSYVAPGNSVEQTMVDIWIELLKLEKVGIHDDFFESGGHSLLATRLVSRIRRAFDVEIPLRSVFEGPTVAAMSELIQALLQQKLSAAEGSALAQRDSQGPVRLQKRPERLPLSYAQQRIWFLDKLEGSSTEYNLRKALRLKGELDCTALEQAINALIERHESLRTHFIEEDGEPLQVVESAVHVSIVAESLCELDARKREQAVEAAMRVEAQEPFDLSRGPLLRMRLLKLDEREHVLLSTFHHIIFDGWSAAVFNRDLSALYEAFRRGDRNPLKPLVVQYPDYALWQRERLEGEELQRQLSYWKNQLADAPTLALPTDLPRPSRPTFAGASQYLIVPLESTSKLKELGRQENATLFMTMLAAFQLLLSRYSRQEDISVGIPAANRTHVELEDLIGFFLDTLVLRTDLSGDPSFRELLRCVQKTTLEAYAHADVGFERLVQELQPERSLNQTPLFQAFLNFLSFEEEPVKLAGLEAERCLRESLKSKFDLTLYVREGDDGLRLSLVYQASLFSPERITHFLDQFEHLVAQVAENPDRPIQSYSLVTEKARPLLPDPTISLPEPAQVPVTSLFLSNAKVNPGQIALRQDGQEWMFQELAKSAKEIAALLAARGVQPGDVVAVSGPRSFGLISGMIGVLLARGVLLTLDSSLPIARRDLMLRAASGKHWLSIIDPNGTTEEGSEAFQSLPVTRISCQGACLDPLGCRPPAGTIASEVDTEDPAYVFFTSGTTGVPKGILGTHKALSHFLQWEQQALSIIPSDRVAQLTGLSFDVVLRDIFLPLSTGATLCLPDTASVPHGEDVISWMRRERITILHTVPSLATAWLDTLESNAGLQDLRWTLMAGEPLTDILVRRWREKMGTAHGILNLYGPTETTLAKCAYRVPAAPTPGVQPVGMPFPDTQALVLNRANQLCGIGEPGEIVIRTPFRTLGYLDGAQEGRAGFAPNPFRDDLRDVIYRTGDCGRYSNEGLLLISGRLDDQLKIRGNRVEPAEVAAVLAQYPEVQKCAVVGREDGNADKCLVAYVVRKPSEIPFSVGALRDFLKQKLPDYMIPAAFVTLDKLPLNSNGKLDRKALPAPSQETRAYVAPVSPLEKTLADIWVELLKLEKVGIHDDFFESGGHSLLATRLVSRIRRAFDIEIPLRAVFESPSIAALGELIQNVRWASGCFESELPPGEREEIVL